MEKEGYDLGGGCVVMSLESQRRKPVFIDTNCINDDGSIKLHEMMVNNLGLQPGEKVIAYQEEDCWDAEIVYANNCWSVNLLSETKKVSKERQEGQEEGFWAGYYVQSMRMLRVLEELEYSATDIERIKDKLGLK